LWPPKEEQEEGSKPAGSRP